MTKRWSEIRRGGMGNGERDNALRAQQDASLSIVERAAAAEGVFFHDALAYPDGVDGFKNRPIPPVAPPEVTEADVAAASAMIYGLETKPTNPKDAIGSDKLPLHLWPETATIFGCLGMLDGALKYGRNNFRETGVRLTIYIDAVKRHINALFEGEWLDPDSGVPHLSHALACLAIIADAYAAGELVDDRQYPGGYRELVEELTPHVARLKAKHIDKSPKHWTIEDA